MASIKQLTERKYKITISNGYRNGKKICKSQTIQVPKSVASRSIRQYVMHEAEELERRFKYGFSEDGSTAFQDYAEGWLSARANTHPVRWLPIADNWRWSIPTSVLSRCANCAHWRLKICSPNSANGKIVLDNQFKKPPSSTTCPPCPLYSATQNATRSSRRIPPA